MGVRKRYHYGFLPGTPPPASLPCLCLAPSPGSVWTSSMHTSSSCRTTLTLRCNGVAGSAAEAQWYQQQLAQIAQTAGRKKRALPVPGTTGLVPGSAAEAQWYQQQLAQIALTVGRKKRALPVPGTTGLVPGSAAEAQWYQQQLAQIALTVGRKKRALPVPGTTG